MHDVLHSVTASAGLSVSTVRASERELPHVLGLLAELMPGADVELRHAWLYERNPHGRAVTVVAYHRPTGEPAGVASVFPRLVSVRGGLRRGGVAGDAYVKPAWRNRGIGRMLCGALLQRMRDEGVEFLFGPIAPARFRVLAREGARVVTQLRRYARPPAIQRAFRASARLVGTIPHVDAMSGCDPRIDALWERHAHGGAIVPVRDARYFAWRYGEAPSRAQHAMVLVDGTEPLAACVIERRGAKTAIVDLLAPADRLPAAARAVADACGTGAVSICLNQRGPGTEGLWHAGFAPRDATPFHVLAAAEPVESALFDGSAWYTTWGDGDLADQIL